MTLKYDNTYMFLGAIIKMACTKNAPEKSSPKIYLENIDKESSA